MDYTEIKKHFDEFQKKFPLEEQECVDLTEEEKSEITPCGTYCGSCEDYGVVCDGCRNRLGKPIWYDLYDRKETCCYYTCTQEKKIHDCSQCDQMPCGNFFEYPDPTMSEEIKQMFFRMRMENFNRQGRECQILIKDTFAENEKYYKK